MSLTNTQSLMGKLKWGEYLAKEDSTRDESRRVQTVELGGMTFRREEVRREESKEETTQQAEPSEMKAVIKRLTSDKYGGISQLLPATGWSHTEGMKGRAGRQRSHIPLFSTQSLVLSSCVFMLLPEGIKVSMLAYPQHPHTDCIYPSLVSIHSSLLHSHHPSFPSSCSVGGAIWDSLVWLCNTTAQICSVSLRISYLLCLTSRDKPVFIALPDPLCKSVQHKNTPTQVSLRRMPTG